MAHIKVWCEYDFGGSFGGNNNEEVYEISDFLSKEDIDVILETAFAELWEEVDEEKDGTTILEAGLLGWEYITIDRLGE